MKGLGPSEIHLHTTVQPLAPATTEDDLYSGEAITLITIMAWKPVLEKYVEKRMASDLLRSEPLKASIPPLKVTAKIQCQRGVENSHQ